MLIKKSTKITVLSIIYIILIQVKQIKPMNNIYYCFDEIIITNNTSIDIYINQYYEKCEYTSREKNKESHRSKKINKIKPKSKAKISFKPYEFIIIDDINSITRLSNLEKIKIKIKTINKLKKKNNLYFYDKEINYNTYYDTYFLIKKDTIAKINVQKYNGKLINIEIDEGSISIQNNSLLE